MATAPRTQATRRTIMVASLLVIRITLWIALRPDGFSSRPLNNTGAGRTSQYHGLRHSDKQTVLDNTGHSRQPGGQRFGIGDAPQRGIQYPVTAVRDESVAVLALPKRGAAWTS